MMISHYSQSLLIAKAIVLASDWIIIFNISFIFMETKLCHLPSIALCLLMFSTTNLSKVVALVASLLC